MRILIKGGVWKNTEDEILKAAVMKYGKNQWARVASLLNRKTANQCKARWYEWLDPSIKKTDWNREEEEKLLHLAKLMPNQWRTIAPIVGRTAGQCIEHYERLLDQAQQQVEGEGEGDGKTGGADDPRRLRPGEIDPAPETKPARPDPIDMDEDEKEMLSEARARLANTKGKKAKRKARERQLEESRRLSVLQKRRELKAAGIESKLVGNKKRKYIDYAREIPFQKLPPSGFFDVAEETAAGKKMYVDPKTQGMEISKMEGRHEKEENEKEKNKDKKRLKTLFKANAAQAIMKVSEANDPTSLRRRTSLSLPMPQVSDGELEDIVKMGQASMMPPPIGGLSGGVSTQALIGDYSSAYKQTPTPLRTPMQEDIIMQEARNARALRDMTPLAGKDLPELYEGTGFDGITPRAAKLATPNTLLSASATPSSRFGDSTPLGTPASSVFGRTPVRDHFGLNEPFDDSMSMADTASTSSRIDKHRSQRLHAQLQGLPEPEYTYEVSVPTVEDVDDDEDDEGKDRRTDRPEDAADVIIREQRRRAAEEEAELARRSSVIRRTLPRPFHVSKSLAGAEEGMSESSLINKEMVQLLMYDDYKHPQVMESKSGKKVAGGRPMEVVLDDIDDSYLQMAKEEITAEAYLVKKDIFGKAFDSLTTNTETEMFAQAWEEIYRNTMFIPTRKNSNGGEGEYGVPTNKTELIASLYAQFHTLKDQIIRDSKKANKIETKLQMISQGYLTRSEALKIGFLEAFDQYNNTMIEYECFKQLQESERRALPARSAQAKAEMMKAEAGEAELQLKYAHLMRLSQQLQLQQQQLQQQQQQNAAN